MTQFEIETFGFAELAQLVKEDIELLRLWHQRGWIPPGELINGVRRWRWEDAEQVEADCAAAKVAAARLPTMEPKEKQMPKKQMEKRMPKEQMEIEKQEKEQKLIDIGRPPQRRMDLPAKSLRVDERHYQRSKVNKKKIQKMYDTFDWHAFHSLLVARRADGTYWIVDGHQRFIVCLLLGVEIIPCEVFDSSGFQEEASVFKKVDERTQLNPFERYRAAVASREEPAYGISKLLVKLGLKPGDSRNGGKSPRVVGFLDRITKNIVQDRKATEEALQQQLAMTGEDGPMSLNPHKGFYFLLHNPPEIAGKPSPIDDADIAKLRVCGGRTTIESEISQLQALCGKSGRPHSPFCAQAILNLINKGKRRNKKTLPITVALPVSAQQRPNPDEVLLVPVH
jgi:hypothetical protein